VLSVAPALSTAIGRSYAARGVFIGFPNQIWSCTEREGFEPSNEVNPRYAISSRARSTAPAPLQPSRAQRPAESLSAADRLQRMLLAASAAFSKDVGLIVTFVGIGVVVNLIVVYLAVQVRGEHSQNQERRASGP
jgi:hypothetical protein